MKLPGVVWLVVLLVVIGGAGFFLKDRLRSAGLSNYQAVFLSNGQVYFGHVKNERSNPIVVSDIYYLRVQRQLQPPAEEETQKPQVQLIKLGSEIHGPQDEMRINRDQVLFIEDLKEDGQVVKAIREFQKTGGAPVGSAPSPSETAAPTSSPKKK